MRPPVELHGQPAASGMAAGPLFRLQTRIGGRRPSGSPAIEQRDLAAAVKTAAAAVAALAERMDGEAAEILEFQVAMLEDASLIDPALTLIDEGSDAASAWSDAVNGQIADYERAEDEYFRARASDLRDLRDRVLCYLSGEADTELPPGVVLAGEDVTPSRFLSVDWSRGGGVALFAGSPSGHVAMLARSLGVPMVVGLGAIELSGHDAAVIDGDSGRVILSPGADEYAALEAAQHERALRTEAESRVIGSPAVTADGHAVSVMINVADPDELSQFDPTICDGVGLVRTELLFYRSGGLVDEDTQMSAYRQIVDWAGPRPVVFRVLDAGGDKPIEGLTIPGESNPFLGTRGIRLLLKRPDVLRTQFRALAQVAVTGHVRIMLPMVTVPEEIEAASRILDGVVAELAADQVPHHRPPLGIMVEVPAVAIAPERFRQADFFSIGSNDLTQYVMASARDLGGVAGLNDPADPAVLDLIDRVVAAGRTLGRAVSLCGDMGGDPAHLPALLRRGLRTVSVAPRLVGRTKLAIASIAAGDE
jgi:phosphoenolpyruvate-protein phosphotransferase (PTS system enzyme I)